MLLWGHNGSHIWIGANRYQALDTGVGQSTARFFSNITVFISCTYVLHTEVGMKSPTHANDRI